MGKQELALLIPVIAVFFSGLIILSKTAIGRAFARRIGGDEGPSPHEIQRIEDLEQEMALLRHDLSETQERLDFTERLLSRGAEEGTPRA